MLVQTSRWGPASLASGVDLGRLDTLLKTGARMLKVDDATVTVLTLTNDEHLREYNRRYRGLDEPTDVLAFAAREEASDRRFRPPPGTEHWLGDIVISLPRARRQAREAGHPIDDEVRLLAVHGFLHLLGYDHVEEGAQQKMKALTDKILRSSP
jgi:probable rRNA maturation factor